jgi:pimeloyl-ACP methyl ester carboxylesterase
MHSWQSGDVEANGIRLHYARTGVDKPPLVLVHGITDDGLCWTSVAAELEPSYDVIMVDARGHGESDAPEHGYGPVDQANDLAGVIAGLQLRPPIVLGHSMGAITALALAGLFPEVPRAILLEDPPLAWMDASARAATDEQWQAQMRAWITGLKSKTREEIIAGQHAAAPDWSEAELGPWADSKLRVRLNIFNPDPPSNVDGLALLARIRCPVLLITADPERGALVTGEDAAALQRMVPQLCLAHIPGAGHSIHREQFARYIDVVCAFLAGLPESV